MQVAQSRILLRSKYQAYRAPELFVIKLDLGSIFGLGHCRIEGVFLLRVVAGLENCTELFVVTIFVFIYFRCN